MKISYLLHLNLGSQSGVYKKVMAQVRTWLRLGHSVAVFCATRESQIANSLAREKTQACVVQYRAGYRALLDRYRAMSRLADEIELWNPDMIYTRQDLYYPSVESLARKFPVISEINSDVVEELYSYSKGQWAYHLLFRRRIDRLIAGLAFVTRELAVSPYYMSYFEGIPRAIIANGVDLDAVPRLPLPHNDTPSLLFIGQPAPWHGMDRISELAALFPHWRLHLVGVSPGDYSFPKNVEVYGVMDQVGYLPIAAQCHVAIGTLALYRNNMQEASPLKVREYLAMGLPVIVGYEDTDFSAGSPFMFRLPNDSHPLVGYRDEISSFVIAWMDKRVPREAVLFLDCVEKEKQRLDLFEKALKRWDDRGRN